MLFEEEILSQNFKYPIKIKHHMDIPQKLGLIKQVGEEIVTEEELKQLLETKKNIVAYDGFEPSGKIHIAQGILRAVNINKMVKAGIKFKMLVADWHAWANNKFNGDLEKIQAAGKYMIEVWKASGMELSKVEFVWANELIKEEEYWKKVMQIARNSTVNRIIRTGQIMGRKEAEIQQASQIFYPCMQAADIFHLNVDICQLGMDQRKVSILARELGEKIGFYKPVIVSHHMLMGLTSPVSREKDAVERAIELKMSKSKPETAIFMNDSEAEIKSKINKAYCPEKITEENPILEYCRYIIFEKFESIEIKRPEKFGGNLNIESYEELKEIYKKEKLHPADLKTAVSFYLNELVKPVRNHFEKDQKAKKLFETISGFEVTR